MAGYVREQAGKLVRVPSYLRRDGDGGKEDAPGLPSRKRKPLLPVVTKPEQWTLAIQEHRAHKAGLHYDVRLVDPKGRAHSFATKMLPQSPGDTTIVAHQPLHTGDYATKFEGEISEGYGAGTVKLLRVTPIEVQRSTGDKLTFFVHGTRRSEEFTVLRQSDGQWRLVNHSPTRARFPKVHRRRVYDLPKKQFDAAKASVASAKVDGARSVVYLPHAGGHPRVLSYRSAKGDHGVIDYTHKIPGLWKQRVPAGVGGTVLVGDTYARHPGTGNAVRPETVGAMLNSGVERSRQLQAKHGKLQVALHDVVKFRGHDVSGLSFLEKLPILEDVARRFEGFEVVPWADTPRGMQKLLDDVFTGKVPATREGIVVHYPTGAPKKVKDRVEHDVYIRGFYGGKGHLSGKGVGGLYFSWTPQGPIVGRVGSGLTEARRREMKQHPERFLGRVARVASGGRFKSGALMAPAFKGLHVDKPA